MYICAIGRIKGPQFVYMPEVVEGYGSANDVYMRDHEKMRLNFVYMRDLSHQGRDVNLCLRGLSQLFDFA